jgi:hypothetical protein
MDRYELLDLGDVVSETRGEPTGQPGDLSPYPFLTRFEP